MRSSSSRSLFLGVCLVAVGLPATVAQTGPEAPPGSIRFIGRNSLGKANGEFGAWRFTAVQIDRASPGTSVVELEVDVTSIDTGIGLRDSHLRSPDFFDVEKYPVASVRVHHASAAGQSERGHPRYTARFDLRIRDVEKTVEASFERIDDSRVEGSLTINRIDFGVGKPRSRWNPFSVHEEVVIRFTARLPTP